VITTLQPAVWAPPPLHLHSPMSCDVVSSNQSGVLKHNTLTLGMLCQGGGHGQGHSGTLNFNLYNNTNEHEPPAGRWLPLPPPPSAKAVSMPRGAGKPLVLLLSLHSTTVSDLRAATASSPHDSNHALLNVWHLIEIMRVTLTGFVRSWKTWKSHGIFKLSFPGLEKSWKKI